MPGAGKGRRGEKEPLDGLVADDLAAGHGKLLASGGVPKEQADEFLGHDLIAALTEHGLVQVFPHTQTSAATIRAVPPDVAMMALLAEIQNCACTDYELIVKCVQRLHDYLAGPAGASDEDHRSAAMIITDKEEVLARSKELIYSVHHEWMTLENTRTDMAITDDFDVRIPPAFRGKIHSRAIYDLAAVQHPVVAASIERAIAEGEQARVLPEVVMKLQLADTLAALLPLSPTASGGALLIRGSDVPILHMLKDYFELKWAAATPFGSCQAPPGSPLSPDQHKVLQLMAQGLTNSAIARRLDSSTSTVSRNVELIYKKLDVPHNSRFAAGVAAQRLGWLDEPEGAK